MSKYVILHGHFYQPPRENPWTGNIGYQESAAPFSDWNRRINAECYAACAASRVLDPTGRILSIVNNYKTLSWNFGPTLLSWMEKEAPNVYAKILEADAESLERLGYGNAVAQAYNHTILPLDRPEDAETQVIWGLTDFRHRFGRDADGMWLPECAVNETVLDILIGKGLSYVILSPWQGRALKDENGKWKDLGGEPAPVDRPFLIRRPGGDIAAFFYDPVLASGISFGHLLRSREGFEAALDDAFQRSGGDLVTIATDGEIYGHHEPFGDMCLAALTDRMDGDSDFIFTNYAAYLADNPPTEEVRLGAGDDGLGNSWSCSHGVGRWMRDCGCSTGGREGWTQQWRTPLREAYDRLRDEAEDKWTDTAASLTGSDARDVLNGYGTVVCGRETPEDFVKRLVPEASGEDATRLLEALEGAKYLQFMYTSCGWFFADLSGLEPVQNMRYAYRAAELLDPEGSEDYLDDLRKSLKKAKSNLEEAGTGEDLLEDRVIPHTDPEAVAAAAFFWRDLYNLTSHTEDSGDLAPGLVTRRTTDAGDGGLTLEGEVGFTRLSLLKTSRMSYRTRVDGRLFCPVVSIHGEHGWTDVPIKAIPRDTRQDIQDTILERSEEKLRSFIGNQALVRLRDVKLVRELEIPLDRSGSQSLELSLHYGPILAMERLEELPASKWPEALSLLDEILRHRKEYGIDSDDSDLETRAGNLVSGLVEDLQAGGDRDILEPLVRFLEIIQEHGLRPLKPYAQNSVYGLLAHRSAEDCDDGNNYLCDEDLRALAVLMNINPERFL